MAKPDPVGDCVNLHRAIIEGHARNNPRHTPAESLMIVLLADIRDALRGKTGKKPKTGG